MRYFKLYCILQRKKHIILKNIFFFATRIYFEHQQENMLDLRNFSLKNVEIDAIVFSDKKVQKGSK